MAKEHLERNRGDGSDDPLDPLGELITRHGVTLGGALIVSGAIAALGLGVLGYAFLRNPWSPGFAAFGGIVLLSAAVLLAINVVNVGRRLELRKRGIRFVASGTATEMLWADIEDVRLNRTDATNFGVGTLYTSSEDALKPSGPLTNTDWDVTIHAHDDRSIRLTPTFMRIVSDPKQLISNLRMRAGMP